METSKLPDAGLLTASGTRREFLRNGTLTALAVGAAVGAVACAPNAASSDATASGTSDATATTAAPASQDPRAAADAMTDLKTALTDLEEVLKLLDTEAAA